VIHESIRSIVRQESKIESHVARTRLATIEEKEKKSVLGNEKKKKKKKKKSKKDTNP
jgi:hypothetical protein